MHLATSATYLADGSESCEHAITTGIRQGCPLAPVLFILALDSLYEMIQHDPRIQGIQLTAESLKVAGFADDTALFLASATEEQHCLDDLRGFGDASDLRVNLHKCRSLYLHPTGHDGQDGPRQIELVASTQHLRHLGAHIASEPNRAAIWELTLQPLRARLALAQVKTMNLLQRIQISRAVILPKLLFVGRHSWPSRATIEKLQKILHNYAWHGALTATGRQGRAWFNQDTAELPWKLGGLALPNLLHEFELLAAKTTARWPTPKTSFAASIGTIMLWKPHNGRQFKPAINVSRQPVAAIQYADSISSMGARVIRAATAQPRTQKEAAPIDEAWHAPPPHDPTELWDGEWLYLDVSNIKTVLSRLGDHQARTHGVFQVASLHDADVSITDLLIGPTGTALSRANYNCAASNGTTIGEIVTIEYYGNWKVRCKHNHSVRQLRGRRAEGFALLCRALVINYPALVLPQSPSEYIQPQPPTLSRWSLQHTQQGLNLHWEPIDGVRQSLGHVATVAEAARLARAVDTTVGSFLDHPWLAVPAAVWAHPQHRATTRQCRKEITRTAKARGLRVVQAKAQQSQREGQDLAAALGRLSWADIDRLPHGTSSQRLLLLRLKHMRLGGWDRLHNKRGCPHCPRAGGEATTTFHTVWTCEQAVKMWAQQRETWRKWGAWTEEAETKQYEQACMSLWLTRVSTSAWNLPTLRRAGTPDAATVQMVFDTFNELWQRHCLLTLQILWRWRCGLHNPHNQWSAAQALALQGARARATNQTMIDHLRVHPEAESQLSLLTELSQWQADTQRPPEPAISARRFVLFFDGGSRGNRGPGGSGAVVVATNESGTEASIVWAAAMSYSQSDMTNNRAEYLGAIAGLRAAFHQLWTPLDVVGDSALILRQLGAYRAPKNEQLRPLYAKARATADKLGVSRWIHHFRAHNKMADAAANIAMDARASTQVFFPTARTEFQVPHSHLASDFLQWQAGLQARLQGHDHDLSLDSSS